MAEAAEGEDVALREYPESESESEENDEMDAVTSDEEEGGARGEPDLTVTLKQMPSSAIVVGGFVARWAGWGVMMLSPFLDPNALWTALYAVAVLLYLGGAFPMMSVIAMNQVNKYRVPVVPLILFLVDTLGLFVRDAGAVLLQIHCNWTPSDASDAVESEGGEDSARHAMWRDTGRHMAHEANGSDEIPPCAGWFSSITFWLTAADVLWCCMALVVMLCYYYFFRIPDDHHPVHGFKYERKESGEVGFRSWVHEER